MRNLVVDSYAIALAFEPMTKPARDAQDAILAFGRAVAKLSASIGNLPTVERLPRKTKKAMTKYCDDQRITRREYQRIKPLIVAGSTDTRPLSGE